MQQLPRRREHEDRLDSSLVTHARRNRAFLSPSGASRGQDGAELIKASHAWGPDCTWSSFNTIS